MRKVLRFVIALVLFYFSGFSEGIEENCTDFKGKTIEHGILYVPGPSVCSMCVCYHSEPKWCSDIYCDPPYFCNKFRVKERCCEFECLDPPGDIAAKMLQEHRRKSRNSADIKSSDAYLRLTIMGLVVIFNYFRIM